MEQHQHQCHEVGRKSVEILPAGKTHGCLTPKASGVEPVSPPGGLCSLQHCSVPAGTMVEWNQGQYPI